MKITLPFPNCPQCDTKAPSSYHRGCGGKLRIETSTDEVYCDKCNHHWNIWDSSYYCSCGHCFSANEVRFTLTAVLVGCRAAAEELSAQNAAKQARIKISERSLRSFFESFFERLGYSFGVAVGTIIESAISMFLK